MAGPDSLQQGFYNVIPVNCYRELVLRPLRRKFIVAQAIVIVLLIGGLFGAAGMLYLAFKSGGRKQ